MMTKEERAKHALMLLRDPILVEAFELIRKESLDSIVNSRPRQHKKRESAYLEIAALDRVRNQLKSTVNDVKLAAHKRRS